MNISQLEAIETAVVDLSRSIGQWMKEERLGFDPSAIERKSFNSFVSYVDTEAEVRFVDALREIVPDSGFITEEGTADHRNERFRWVIDPLDGTTNYIQGIPVYCTSVALMDRDELVLGVVYEPNLDECFHAFRGSGCKLNGLPCQVSGTGQLLKGLIATGFPYHDFERQTEYFQILRTFTEQSRGLRRLGSAAIDLAYVACGRFEGFYEYGLNPWDVAAGSLLVREANGSVTDFKGGKNYFFGAEIIADNGLISNEFQQIIEEGFHGRSKP